jgi:hypothetical protein
MLRIPKIAQPQLPARQRRIPGEIVATEKKTLLRSEGDVGFHREYVDGSKYNNYLVWSR